MYTAWILAVLFIGSTCGLRSVNLAGTIQVDNGKQIIRNNGDYPYVVQIFENNRRICAGTIVGPKTVITAGSCYSQIGRNAKIYAGTITKQVTKTTQMVGVEEVVQHNCADLTLILTAKKFSFDKYVQKVKLATTTQRDRNINKLVTIVGFHMQNAVYPSTLHWADVNLMSENICKAAIKGAKVALKNKLCVIGGQRDVAIGRHDYGAPLVKFVEGKAYLLGVASQVFLANNKPTGKQPTIYTDVTELEEFIKNPNNRPTGCFGF